jgi:phosphopantetheinyl transferase
MDRYQLAGDLADAEPMCDTALLFDNERAHIQHYKAPSRMRESLTGIRMIKTLVGELRGQDPARIQLSWDASGVPQVSCHPADPEDPTIPVSISHSKGLVTAVCRHPVDREGRHRPCIGIDMETRSDTVPASVVELFSEPERSWLALLPEWQASLAFAHLWTLKEALFKCSTVAFEEILSRNVLYDQVVIRNDRDSFHLDTQYLDEIDNVVSIALRLRS